MNTLESITRELPESLKAQVWRIPFDVLYSLIAGYVPLESIAIPDGATLYFASNDDVDEGAVIFCVEHPSFPLSPMTRLPLIDVTTDDEDTYVVLSQGEQVNAS